ncbi:MAG: polyprenol monophosphomannose synthase [Candidatus Bathyarchaeia archaeon]
MDKVSIIVPTYNERENVQVLIEKIRSALRDNFEIIVVDDSSPDGTSETVNQLSKTIENLRLVCRKSKRGLASAVIDGFNHANGSILGVMDADLQHPPELLQEMVRKIHEGADIVIASRYVKDSRIMDWSPKRKFISKVASFPARIIFHETRKISDPLSGFFMLRRKVLKNTRLNPVGFKILLEILVKGSYEKVVELPYVFGKRKRGETKLNMVQILNYMRHVLRLIVSK